jgi:hypothetical protein
VKQSYSQLKTNTNYNLPLVYMVGYQNTVWVASLLPPTHGLPSLLALCRFVCTLSGHLLYLSLDDCQSAQDANQIVANGFIPGALVMRQALNRPAETVSALHSHSVSTATHLIRLSSLDIVSRPILNYVRVGLYLLCQAFKSKRIAVSG